MAETPEARGPDAPSPEARPDLADVEPIKSTVVSQGLIGFPDALAFWRRRRHPKPA